MSCQARLGIPDAMRAEVWLWVSGGAAKQQAAGEGYYSKQLGLYQQQHKRARRKTLADIDKVCYTHPSRSSINIQLQAV